MRFKFERRNKKTTKEEVKEFKMEISNNRGGRKGCKQNFQMINFNKIDINIISITMTVALAGIIYMVAR